MRLLVIRLFILSGLFFPALASAMSCNFPNGSYCVDYGAAYDSSMTNCGNVSGFNAVASCPTSNMIGTCTITGSYPAGNTIAEHWYSGGPLSSANVAAISAACTSSNSSSISVVWTAGNASPAPITVTTTGVVNGLITAPIATVTATIKVNAADVGKTRQVFVTAMLPSAVASALGMRPMASATPDAKPMGATSTRFVLAQKTQSGWQQVMNGQLLPYSTGVLGDQTSAISILNNTSTASLKGAQFCVGYGANVTDMNSTGKMVLIGTVPDSNGGSSSSGCILISDARVFTFLQANYPTFFTGKGTSGQYQQYDYQYYQPSGNILIIDTSDVLYVFGPLTGNALTPVGPVENLRTPITGWEATQPH